MSENKGKSFESDIEKSCLEQLIFYFRVRDVNLPPDVRMRVKLPKNKYDCLMFYKGYLFPIEMKSTKAKSISLKESMIKEHQIINLLDSVKYDGSIAGFIMNFREPENRAFFIHIYDFVKYKNIAENQLDHTYKAKVNKASIPLGICEEIGIELKGVKKVKKYRWFVSDLLEKLIDRYTVWENKI